MQGDEIVNEAVNDDLRKPIVVMAGGTGGHVFPALAVAENLRERGEDIVWFGTRSGLEARVAPAANFPIEWLNIQGLRGKGLFTLLLAPFRLLRACWQALRILRRNRPKAVLGMGGFVSAPGGLMAWILDIPLYLHEQNSIVGLTNKMLCRFAQRNYSAFPHAAGSMPRSECIGNPLRTGFENLEGPSITLQGRLDTPLHLLVVGGSRGAAALNRSVPEAIACLDPESRPRIRHQCGEQHYESCAQNYAAAKIDADIVSFIDDMREAYGWADLVLCRAGALTIAELTAVGRAALFVPFPYAVDNHQYHNARFLEQAGAAQIMLEADMSAESLALKLQFFQQNRDTLIDMAHKSRALYRADAANRLASDILAGVRI